MLHGNGKEVAAEVFAKEFGGVFRVAGIREIGHEHTGMGRHGDTERRCRGHDGVQRLSITADAESEVRVRINRIRGRAVGGAQMLAEIEVAAAAVHTVGTAFGPRRIAGLLRVIRTVIVEHPFGDVAVGVVEAESVGLQLIHGDGLPAVAAGAHRRILLIHVVLFYKIGIGTLEVDVIAGNLIANVENGLRAGADRVLPLRFGEQTVAACLSVPGNGLTCDRVHGFEPFLHAQGVAVLHGGKPGHVFHWQAFSSVGTGIAAHDSLIVFLRYGSTKKGLMRTVCSTSSASRRRSESELPIWNSAPGRRRKPSAAPAGAAEADPARMKRQKTKNEAICAGNPDIENLHTTG